MRTALKQFRVGLHLTQAEMADKCGVSRRTYAYVENGVRGGSASFWTTLKREFNVPDEKMWGLQKID